MYPHFAHSIYLCVLYDFYNRHNLPKQVGPTDFITETECVLLETEP